MAGLAIYLWCSRVFLALGYCANNSRIDLPPKAPSFITRVCGFGFHSLRFRLGQARRARSPHSAQAPGAGKTRLSIILRAVLKTSARATSLSFRCATMVISVVGCSKDNDICLPDGRCAKSWPTASGVATLAAPRAPMALACTRQRMKHYQRHDKSLILKPGARQRHH